MAAYLWSKTGTESLDVLVALEGLNRFHIIQDQLVLVTRLGHHLVLSDEYFARLDIIALVHFLSDMNRLNSISLCVTVALRVESKRNVQVRHKL